MDKLNPDDARPPYQQVADALRHEIETGQFKPGDKLPAHHVVVSQFGVSLGTVKRAYGALQKDGWIITRQGQGSFVRPRASEPDASQPDSLAEVRRALAGLSDRVVAIERRLSGL